MEWLDEYDEMRIEKAHKKGLKEGVEQGRTEGTVALLEEQLTQRFGELPQTVKKRLAKASREQLVAWGHAVLVAETLKQVFE